MTVLLLLVNCREVFFTIKMSYLSAGGLNNL